MEYIKPVALAEKIYTKEDMKSKLIKYPIYGITAINISINNKITMIIAKTIHHTIYDPTPILLISSMIPENENPWEKLPVSANLQYAIVANNIKMMYIIKLIIKVRPMDPIKLKAKSEDKAPPAIDTSTAWLNALAAPVANRSIKNIMVGIII